MRKNFIPDSQKTTGMPVVEWWFLASGFRPTCKRGKGSRKSGTTCMHVELHLQKKSFTLIELLIATAIISIILISLYSVFNAGLLSYKKLDSAFDTYQSARIILNRLESDIRNIFAYKEKDLGFKGSAQSMKFFKVADIYNKDQVFINICQIQYEFFNNCLKRTVYAGEDALLLTQGQTEELSSNIKDISFQYCYKTDLSESGHQWQDAWPQEDKQKNLLPLAIKIKIVLRLTKDNAVEFNKVIPLAISGRDNEGARKNNE